MRNELIIFLKIINNDAMIFFPIRYFDCKNCSKVQKLLLFHFFLLNKIIENN
jgi:hypothetical protein